MPNHMGMWMGNHELVRPPPFGLKHQEDAIGDAPKKIKTTKEDKWVWGAYHNATEEDSGMAAVNKKRTESGCPCREKKCTQR